MSSSDQDQDQDHPTDAPPPVPLPPPGAPALTRLLHALAQDKPSPLKRELLARSLLLNAPRKPRR